MTTEPHHRPDIGHTAATKLGRAAGVALLAIALAMPASALADTAMGSCDYDPFGLSSSRTFTVFGMDGATIENGTTSTVLNGNAGLGPNTGGVLNKTTLSGDLYVDPTSTTDISNVGTPQYPISGQIIYQDLSNESDDAYAASTFWAAQTLTQTVGDLEGGDTFTLTNNATNVISIDSLLYVGDTMTIVGNGDSDTIVVFNVAGNFRWHGGTLVLSGGITPPQIMWNFPTSGLEILVVQADAYFAGNILAPSRAVTLDKATMDGRIFSGSDILLHSAAVMNGPTCMAKSPTPTPSTTPDSGATPEPSPTPTPSTTPEPSTTPDPLATPEPSATPTPEGTPDPSATPEPSATPTPEGSLDPNGTPEPTPTPAPTLPPEETPTFEPTLTEVGLPETALAPRGSNQDRSNTASLAVVTIVIAASLFIGAGASRRFNRRPVSMRVAFDSPWSTHPLRR